MNARTSIARVAAGLCVGVVANLDTTIRARLLPALLLVWFSSAIDANQADAVQPEQGYGRTVNEPVTAQGPMAVTAHPLATQAAATILARGGSAADAAIAAQLMLGLVEPQSSGLGGGAFALHWSHDNATLLSYDARETAPASAEPERFLNADGSPMGFRQAVVGGLSVGVPGVPALLWELHQAHGKLPWPSLFESTIKTARDGFAVSERMHHSVANAAKYKLTLFKTTREYFFAADGSARAAGSTLTNSAYARTLEDLAKDGANAFYRGKIARNIVQTVTDASINPGDMTEADLADYRVIVRQPVCTDYRTYRICGMGPPSSGMTTVGQILGALEPLAMDRIGPTPDGYHLFTESSRLAYADRALYLADSDFVDVPVTGLLSAAYLAERSQLINRKTASADVTAGIPPGAPVALTPDTQPGRPGTTHFTIVDAQGNIVSVTSSIETGFGSRLMSGGFLLNNQLTDFSFRPEKHDRLVANRVQPRKRPRSSMAPTIVFDKNDSPVIALGSPGGSRIISYVALTLVRMLDWKMTAQQAVESGHVVNRGGRTDLEKESPAAELLRKNFESRGHNVKVRDLNSGIHLIQFTGDKRIGYADSRREGVAAQPR